MKNEEISWAWLVAFAFDPSIPEAEAELEPGLHSKFQNSQGYVVRPYLRKRKPIPPPNNNNKNTKEVWPMSRIIGKQLGLKRKENSWLQCPSEGRGLIHRWNLWGGEGHRT